eukprot:1199948-Amphidinium_carterae.1
MPTPCALIIIARWWAIALGSRTTSSTIWPWSLVKSDHHTGTGTAGEVWCCASMLVCFELVGGKHKGTASRVMKRHRSQGAQEMLDTNEDQE